MKRTKVISAFPGTGKTYFFENCKNLTVLDSDSSKFQKENFPENYIEHIKDNIGKVDVILVSSHKDTREALVKSGIYFYLVYPDRNCKQEYLERYRGRGNNQTFITLLDKFWDDWIWEMAHQNSCDHLILNTGDYFSDIFPRIESSEKMRFGEHGVKK